MKKRITEDERKKILDMLQRGEERRTIAASLGLTAAQVSAIAAHMTMGTYTGTAPRTRRSKQTLPASFDESALSVVRGDPSRTVGSDNAHHNGSVLLGTDSETQQRVYWDPEPDGGSANPHVLILGESGYGKTYATSCLVAELVQSDVPSVVFDYGQGFSTANAPVEFRDWAHPVEFELNRDGIAINPLEIFPVDLHGPATVAQRIADTFVRAYPRIGVQQHAVLRRAVLELLADAGINQHDRTSWAARPPHFRNLERKLNEFGVESDASQRRFAMTAVSHVSTLFVFDTFRSSGRRLSWGNLTSDRKQAWILQLGGLESSVERTVTEFLLWNLIRFVEAQGPGSLRCFIVLDEAHKLSFAPGSPVEKLLREGRKFGLGVILASQQPEDFSSVAFANTATKIVFQVADERAVISRQLQRKVGNGATAPAISDVITKLPRGSAYVVTQNIGRMVKIASFEDRATEWTARAARNRKEL